MIKGSGRTQKRAANLRWRLSFTKWGIVNGWQFWGTILTDTGQYHSSPAQQGAGI